MHIPHPGVMVDTQLNAKKYIMAMKLCNQVKSRDDLQVTLKKIFGTSALTGYGPIKDGNEKPRLFRNHPDSCFGMS